MILECVYCHGDIDPKFDRYNIRTQSQYNICGYCFVGLVVLGKIND